MIISPSKTQKFTESSQFTTNQPLLLKNSELLITELLKKSVSELAALMKMSERLAVQTHQSVHDFELPFTDENSQPAIEVFKGDVYSRICVDQYGDDEISYIQDHLCILSGLYKIKEWVSPVKSHQTKSRSISWKKIGIVSAFIFISAIAVYLLLNTINLNTSTPASDSPRSIALLPLQNISDEENDYLAEGIQSQIATYLYKIPYLPPDVFLSNSRICLNRSAITNITSIVDNSRRRFGA